MSRLSSWSELRAQRPTIVRGVARSFAVIAAFLLTLVSVVPANAVLPVPTNCQDDIDGANDQPGQKLKSCTIQILTPMTGDIPPNRLVLPQRLDHPYHQHTGSVTNKLYRQSYYATAN